MTTENIYEILFELTADIDYVDKKMKKVVFPVDENNYKDVNFLRLYSCSKQYNVLKKVCSNIIKKLECANSPKYESLINQFEIMHSCIPDYDFDTLEICPEAENLKLKYIKYLKEEKINLENQTKGV